MPYNGSGGFSLFTPGTPFVTGTTISSTVMNSVQTDIASNGLSNCLTKDGQQTPTANIPMGGYRITGLASGLNPTDAANLSQISLLSSRTPSVAFTVGSNNLTATLNDYGGTAPSASNIVSILQRSPTLATGTLISETIATAIAVTAPNGATFGIVSGTTAALYAYVIDNAGTQELALSATYYGDQSLGNTTAISSSSSSNSVIYSTTARTGVAMRCICVALVTHTSGAWTATPTANWAQPLPAQYKGKFSLGPLPTDLVVAYASSTTVTITANQITLYDLTGNQLIYGPYSAYSISTASSGVGGLDTGTISNGWYSVHAISTPAGIQAGILSIYSNARPLMPAGYTYSRLVGYLYYNSGVQVFRQTGNKWWWGGRQTILSGGTASTDTSVAYGSSCPVSGVATVLFEGQLNSNTVGALTFGSVRWMTGVDFATFAVSGTAGIQTYTTGGAEIPFTNLYYAITSGSGNSASLSLYVIGFTF